MTRKELITRLAIILLIFSVGLFVRTESTQLSGIPMDGKAFYENSFGLPYMYDMDSYYNYRLTDNFLNHGYLGDAKINGTEWDLKSYYPPGVPMDYPPLIVYLTAFIYKFINLFGSVPLIVTSFWIPAFIGPLAGVITFLFTRKYTNNYGAAAAGLLAVTAPFYFMRTVPGFFDTDMFNIIFPILVVWFFVEAVNSINDNQSISAYNKHGIFFAIISAIFMFLFSLAWNGWQYMFYIIIIAGIIWIIRLKLRGVGIRSFMEIFSIFIVVSLALIGLFGGYLNIIKLILGPFEVFGLLGHSIFAPWPNVYSLVSELQPPSLKDLITGLGPVLLGLGVFGIFTITIPQVRKRLYKDFSIKRADFLYLILLIWTIAGFITLMEGIRFILLLIPPLTIITGIFVGVCTDGLDILNNKNLKTTLSILAVIIITIPSIIVIQDNLSNLTPRMNDDMWNAGTWIHNNTSNNTVVISSWVYGHFFSGIADRPVVFDGRLGYIETLTVRDYDPNYIYKDKSPSTAREYWIDKALSTSNESLSKGIFTMLSTSGDNGFLTMDQYTKNTTRSVDILNNILGVDKQTAYQVLTVNYSLSPQDAQNVLKYTHPDNPNPSVLVTYNGMIDYGYWIFNFGEWNFNQMKASNFTYSFGNIKEENHILKSDDGLKWDLNTGQILWNNRIPYCIITVNQSNIQKRYLDTNSSFCVVILMEENKSVVLDKRFENSTFTKLILERSNQTAFMPLYQNRNVMIWGITS